MIVQRAQFSVLRVLDDSTGGEGGDNRDCNFGGDVGREVVEVYAFVGASAGEENLLGLFWDWGGRGGECEATDGGGVGVEEECVCELDFFRCRDSCSNAVQDAVVGSSYNLYRDGEVCFGRGS